MTKRRRTVAAAATLVIVFLAANHPLVTGSAAGRWDADSEFAPWQMLVADFARAAQLLIWNPWSSGGSPDFAEPQIGALSPVNILFGLVAGPSEGAFRAYWLALWLTCGLGTMVLALHLAVPPWGALLVGLGCCFCGYLTGHAEHTSRIATMAVLPWMLWRLDRALGSGRLWPAAEAAALWGLSGLSGYPGLLMANAGLALAWVMGRMICGPEVDEPAAGRRPSLWFGIAAAIIFVVVGVAVLSPTYAAFLVEGRGYTDRVGPLDRSTAISSNALHPLAVSTLAGPYLPIVGRYTSPYLWGQTDISSVSLYCGAAVCWLSLFALIHRPRRFGRWWLLGIGVLGFSLAVGEALPLRGWLYDLLPPTRYFRHASMFGTYLIFALLVLAACGCRDLAQYVDGTGAEPDNRHDRRCRVCFGVSGLIVSAVAVGVYFAMTFARYGGPKAVPAALHQFAVWLSVAIVSLLLLRRPWRRGLVAVVLLIAVTDALFTAELTREIVCTYRQDVQEGWRYIGEHRRSSLDLVDNGLERIAQIGIGPGLTNKNLPLKVPVFLSYVANYNEFNRVWAGNANMVAQVIGSDRFWFAPATEVARVGVSASNFAAFVRRCGELEAMPILVHRRSDLVGMTTPDLTSSSDERETIGHLPSARAADVDIVRYEPNRMVLDVSVGEAGYLLVTDRWAQGWQARVDGVETVVLGGNFLFRTIALEPGRHRIDMSYHPFGLPWLLILSWSVLGVVGLGSLVRLSSGGDSYTSFRAGRPMRADS